MLALKTKNLRDLVEYLTNEKVYEVEIGEARQLAPGMCFEFHDAGVVKCQYYIHAAIDGKSKDAEVTLSTKAKIRLAKKRLERLKVKGDDNG